jgi:8-oxo-dGTP diphosphatase
MYPTRQTRAICIMIKDNEVLLIHRFKNDEEYWVFPGGSVDEGETVEEAVVREVLEETSMPTEVDKLLYEHHYETSDQYYYLCKYTSGEPILGNAIEKKRMEKSTSDIYVPEWVAIEQLPNMLVYPLEVRDWLIEDLKSGFKEKPLTATLKASELRKSL